MSRGASAPRDSAQVGLEEARLTIGGKAVPMASHVINVGFYPGPDPSPADCGPYPADPAGSGPGRFASADPGTGLGSSDRSPVDSGLGYSGSAGCDLAPAGLGLGCGWA